MKKKNEKLRSVPGHFYDPKEICARYTKQGSTFAEKAEQVLGKLITHARKQKVPYIEIEHMLVHSLTYQICFHGLDAEFKNEDAKARKKKTRKAKGT